MEREIIDKAIFEDKSLLQLYIYLRSQAKFKPTEKLIDNKKVTLQPGQLTLGSRQLASVLGTSPATAYRLLKKLEKLGEISIKTFKSCSLINLNYWPTEKPKNETPSKPDGARDSDEKTPDDETQTKRKRNADETKMKTPIEGYKDIKNICADVVSYFNDLNGTKYSPETVETKRLIGKLAKRFTVDDFKAVIDAKTAEWKNDKKMQAYLRPKTLFAEINFENYYNQIIKNKSTVKQDSGKVIYE